MRSELAAIATEAQVHCAVLGAAQNEKTKFGASILAGKYDMAIIDEVSLSVRVKTKYFLYIIYVFFV